MAQTRINFGCGQFPTPGWINVDNDARARADVRHDLDVVPYPFESGSADEIVASHVLEHLRHPFTTMAEFARILKPGGIMTIRVPHFSRGFVHADHKCGFDVSFPLYFEPTFPGGYSGTHLELVSTRLRWFGQIELKKRVLGRSTATAAAAIGAVIDALANISPFVTSRVWCFWVGGFEEVEFVFRRPTAADSPTSS
jgi:hypothetical protein